MMNGTCCLWQMKQEEERREVLRRDFRMEYERHRFYEREHQLFQQRSKEQEVESAERRRKIIAAKVEALQCGDLDSRNCDEDVSLLVSEERDPAGERSSPPSRCRTARFPTPSRNNHEEDHQGHVPSYQDMQKIRSGSSGDGTGEIDCVNLVDVDLNEP